MIKKLSYFFTFFLFLGHFALGQTTIEILKAGSIERNPEISEANRLLGGVKLGFGDAVLFCDSAYRYDDGLFEVFSHVRVRDKKGGAKLNAEYAVLNPETEVIKISRDIDFTHDGMTLECPEIFYSLVDKSFRYYQEAKIFDGEKNMVSDRGAYFSEFDKLFAGGDVVITQGGDTITSDSLSINRKKNTLSLYRESRMLVDGSLIECSRGEYNSDKERGWFAGSASIDQTVGYLAGDSIYINQREDIGRAWGNVVVKDSSRAMTITGTFANKEDGIETIFGDSTQRVIATNIEGRDTLVLVSDKLTQEEELMYSTGAVHFKQGDFSGTGDSLSWVDEVVWLLGDPVVWAQQNELEGDSIKMLVKNNKPQKMSLLSNAIVTSEVNDSLENIITGKVLDAFFTEGELSKVEIRGNGDVLYYSEEDSGDIIRNKATCSNITMTFKEGEVYTVTLIKRPEGKLENLGRERERER